MRRFTFLFTLLAMLLASSSSYGAYTTFFGEDLGLGESTRLLSHPNADAAQADFLANLVGVGTEDFESFASGTGAPLAANFGSAGTATFQGGGNVANVPTGTNGVGRYPISGDQYWESGGAFSIDFDAPIAAFGFYGVDIGDFNGQVLLTLTSGAITNINIGNSTGISGGSVLYFGFYTTDPNELVTAINFGNTASGVDFFGFDDMTIGSIEQVVPGGVPEPAAIAVWSILGLVGIGLVRRRRRKAC